jgi:hypothetical protein
MCNSTTHVLFQKSVVSIWIKIYNNVPENITKKLENFKLFKKELKPVLLSNFFNSIDGFYSFE